MPADGSGAIGPVSVRYAAQIRELLYAQAAQRMAADQEAARERIEADRSARTKAAAKTEETHQPHRSRVEPADPYAAPVKAEARTDATPVPMPGAPQLVDIQA